MSLHWSIPRSGAPPLRFTGEQLFAGSTCQSDGAKEPLDRWHELSLFELVPFGETRTSVYCVAVWFLTDWRGEPERRDAVFLYGAECVAQYLRSYDPLLFLVGYPAQPQFADRQERLRLLLRLRWANLVSECLGYCFPALADGPGTAQNASEAAQTAVSPPAAPNAAGATPGPSAGKGGKDAT